MFYFDDELNSNAESEKTLAMMAMEQSEVFLNALTRDLDLSHLETKYKLHKIAEEEWISATNSDFLEVSEVEKDPFYLGRLRFTRTFFQRSEEHCVKQTKLSSPLCCL